MKKLALLLILFVCTSFSIGWPCHPNGDIGPCTHRVHINDMGACSHFDYYGNRLHTYDYYPCEHIVHYGGDIYPCTHICY
jgi:hypothetical protein